MKTNKRLPGITLIETLVSVALIAMIAALSMPILQSFLFQNEIYTATNTVQSGIRLAQNHSRGSDGDSSWGIRIQPGVVTVFKGTSYASRDTNEDRTYDLASRISISGTTEFVFNKQDITPVTAGAVSFTSNNQSKQISINALGGLTVT